MHLPHQPDGQVCHWWPPRRCRIDGTQDHRRYVWRYGISRGWCFQREGFHQGRPFGGIPAARHAARNLVDAGAASRCQIQLAYAHRRRPTRLDSRRYIWYRCMSGTSRWLQPSSRSSTSDRRRSSNNSDFASRFFLPTAACGHFGRTPESKTLEDGRSVDLFTWERSDRVGDVRTALGL